MPATPSSVLAFGLLLGWSTAQAASHAHDASHHSKKPKQPVEAAPSRPVDDAAALADDTTVQADAKHVALQAGDDDADAVHDKAGDKPAAKPATPPTHAPRGWQLELGPYLWASSVNADVSFGPLTTGVELGFLQLVSHTRYGAEALAEARHGRFAISGDLMYGAADYTTTTDIASVMTTITGNAASLMVDAALGYQVLGDEDALFSLEARSGVRYQRTAVSGDIAIAGIMVQTPEIVDSGGDAVVGARAVVRPGHSVRLSGMFDVGVAGASDSTWSAAVDASVCVASRVLLTAGWRTLTTERSHVNITMRGPRVAVQLVF
jgi:hypothetical protein